jgi:hypothetical protein
LTGEQARLLPGDIPEHFAMAAESGRATVASPKPSSLYYRLMRRFDVQPGEGIGPLRIGMTRAEASQATTDVGLSTVQVRRWARKPEVLVVAGQLQAYFDVADRIEEIEVAIAAPDSIRLGGLDFAAAPETVTAALDRLAQADRTDPEYPASSCYPTIGLCVWKDAKPGNWLDGPFQSVLVRRPVRSQM